MSDALEKAKAALAEAKSIEEDRGRNGEWTDLLIVARVQADIAQAEALTAIASELMHLKCLGRGSAT